MKLRIFAAVVLALALIVGLCSAWLLKREYSQAQADCDARTEQLRELQDTARQLQDELDGLTDENAQAQQAQVQELNLQVQQLQAQLEELRTEMEALSSFLAENQDAAAQAQEEIDYLQGVYNALEEGLKEVENYIAGN
jgi:peptidoglycan hydrolase CwlO-like protein